MGIDLRLKSGGHSRNCSLLQFTLAFADQFNNQHLHTVAHYNTDHIQYFKIWPWSIDFLIMHQVSPYYYIGV